MPRRVPARLLKEMERCTRSISRPSARNSSAQKRRANAPRSSTASSVLIRYAPSNLKGSKIMNEWSSRSEAATLPTDAINKDSVDVGIPKGEIIVIGHQPCDPQILNLVTTLAILKSFDTDDCWPTLSKIER